MLEARLAHDRFGKQTTFFLGSYPFTCATRIEGETLLYDTRRLQGSGTSHEPLLLGFTFPGLQGLGQHSATAGSGVRFSRHTLHDHTTSVFVDDHLSQPVAPPRHGDALGRDTALGFFL